MGRPITNAGDLRLPAASFYGMSAPKPRRRRLRIPVLERLLDRMSFVVFGQRAPESRPVGWVPGNGGHGGEGGQTPPWVPYNLDWDPENRIR